MKFEEINGTTCIILEENDNVFLKTNASDKKIKVSCNDKKINISGSSSIIGSIQGEGMLEKIYLPPVISSEEIIRKCDRWIEMYKEIHDKFKELVLSQEYIDERVAMVLSFGKSYLFNCDDCFYTIDLDLQQYGNNIKEGVTISVDDSNIYAYLIANVLDYYLSNNYLNKKVDFLTWNWGLTSDVVVPRGGQIPICSSLNILGETTYYSQIVTAIIGNHNLGESSEQLIFNLRNKISNQPLSEKIESSIKHTEQQYELIFPNSSKDGKGHVLRKNMKPKNNNK